jgi:hypothetical protein
MSEKSEIQLPLLAARKNKKARISILSKRGKWQEAFTLFTFERQVLVMTGFPRVKSSVIWVIRVNASAGGTIP